MLILGSCQAILHSCIVIQHFLDRSIDGSEPLQLLSTALHVNQRRGNTSRVSIGYTAP